MNNSHTLAKTSKRKFLSLIFAVSTLLVATQVHAIPTVIDFEDVSGTAPFTSQGMDFTANGPNATFNSSNSGATNGTNTFGWCGSDCGSLQLITASLPGGTPFSLQSIDAGNLWAAGEELGFVSGMTLDVLGNIFGGGTVSQSLLIIEDVMTTFTFAGFNNIVSLEFTSSAVGNSNPDINIDNLVVNAAVPEPSTLALMGLGLAGIGFSRKRKVV